MSNNPYKQVASIVKIRLRLFAKDILKSIEKSPTFGRKPDFRNQIKDRQQSSTQDRPVEVPKAANRRPSSDSQTIDFID